MGKGVLTVRGRRLEVFPPNANYAMLYITCGVVAAVTVAALLLGGLALLYGVLYSLERFFVEQLRTDSLLTGPKELVYPLMEAGYDPTQVEGVIHIGNFLIFPFKTAQFVSLAAFVICLAALIVLNRKRKLRRTADVE